MIQSGSGMKPVWYRHIPDSRDLIIIILQSTQTLAQQSEPLRSTYVHSWHVIKIGMENSMKHARDFIRE